MAYGMQAHAARLGVGRRHRGLDVSALRRGRKPAGRYATTLPLLRRELILVRPPPLDIGSRRAVAAHEVCREPPGPTMPDHPHQSTPDWAAPPRCAHASRSMPPSCSAGSGTGIWASHIPRVQARLGLDPAVLGIALFFMAFARDHHHAACGHRARPASARECRPPSLVFAFTALMPLPMLAGSVPGLLRQRLRLRHHHRRPSTSP